MGSSRRFETTSMSLHVIAMACMLCDHLWATVVPGNDWLTCVGRLAFPIFAFLIVEGYFHTGSLRRYVGRLLLCALLSEVPFDLVMGGTVFYPFHQNVLWTFLIALLLIRLNERARATGRLWVRLLTGAGTLALGYVLGRHYDGKVKYLVNDLLMNLRGLAPLCIPINKTGKQAKDFPKMVEAGFQSDNQLIMFPAGLCSRRYNGVIRDLEWKKTFVVKSVQTKRDVIPVHFGGRNSDFFYNLANICKALGIKFNIAMLYLADEMFKNRHKTFTVTFGKPIPWQTFDKSKTPAQWAEYVKDIVYKL